MSGAEAAFVVSFISSVISIIQATKTVYDTAQNAKGQPEAFRQVAAKLPLVIKILGSARERAQTLDKTAQEALKPILESCKEKADALQKIFQEVIRNNDDDISVRYKKALRAVKKQGGVERLMEGILKDIHVLACEKLMGTATDDEVKEINEATRQMKDIAPSSQDEAGDAPRQQHSGSGDNISASAGGLVAVNKGDGSLYNISRDAYFVYIGSNPKFQVRDLLEADPRIIDPNDYMKDLLEYDSKVHLLETSYRWILGNADFQRWRNDSLSRLLWIKGDPGKGKTMLLCGIIRELEKSKGEESLLSFFFCRGINPGNNNATAVLRGLIYMLVKQQTSLALHVQLKYDDVGENILKGDGSWVALAEIFTNILKDPDMKNTYLIIDALDECETDLPKLLKFIVQNSTTSRVNVKWLISSRNDKNVEQELRLHDSLIMLSLEQKHNAEQVSSAVAAYIEHCLLRWPKTQNDTQLRASVQEKMLQKAWNETFLWVSLVFEELEKYGDELLQNDIYEVLKEVPKGLKALYDRMIEKIKSQNVKYPDRCKRVLSTVVAAYRPLHLQELCMLFKLESQPENRKKDMTTIVKTCGSFLTIQDDVVYIAHQSAKDHLTQCDYIFPASGIGDVHSSIFSTSLKLMLEPETLRRDIYNLRATGYPIGQVQKPQPDPFATSRYSCIYWINHLIDWNPNPFEKEDRSNVEKFMKRKFLYWVEALSLCQGLSNGLASLKKLEALLQERNDSSMLCKLVRDARRFIMHFKQAIEHSPLQVYESGLLFSPVHSLVKEHFEGQQPKWITIKPAVENEWSPCLQTLEGHSGAVTSVTFSHDSKHIASASFDKTVIIWDISGTCLQKLKGHSDLVNSVTFSHDSKFIVSASDDKTVKIWDISGTCLRTLKGHTSLVSSVAFSHNSTLIASASWDKTVKIWDIRGACLQTLKGHSSSVSSIVFSHDSKHIASASWDKTVKIWDRGSGTCLRTLKDHSGSVNSVAFSLDSNLIVSASEDKTVKIWDRGSGTCLRTLKDHSGSVKSVTFLHDSKLVASASEDKTVKIWDIGSGTCLQTLKGHSELVKSVTFLHDSKLVASASGDTTVKIWNIGSGTCPRTLKDHSGSVKSVTFSHDSKLVASASEDKTVKIWDTGSGACLQTLDGHSRSVNSVTFSHDSKLVASASEDETVKIWDIGSITSWILLFKIWDTCLYTLEGHGGSVNSVSFSHDSKFVVSASGDETVKIWDTSGTCLQTLEGHSDSVLSVTLSHDSELIASGSYDKTVKIWDTRGNCRQTLEGHSGSVNLVTFSHDSNLVASASYDMTVKIWNIEGECLQTLDIGRKLHTISFDATGSRLYTDLGTLSILPVPDSALSTNDPRGLPIQRYSISVDSRWIIGDSENYLWLPPEYRPRCSAVVASAVCIGCSSGQVLTFNSSS